MRTKEVVIADKKILIQEKRIGEIKKLASDLNIDFNTLSTMELKDNENLLGDIFAILENRITVIFPQLTNEDIENAYMSEIEALIEGFMDVNFSTVKKVFLKATTMI